MSELEKLIQNIQKIYLKVNQKFKIIIDRDPNVLRDDSAQGLLNLIEDVKYILSSVNQMPIEQRAKHFNITYNAVTYIADMASLLRKSNYSFQTLKQLIDCILSMEANIILHDVKYLEKRTKIYIDVCHIYEQNEYLQPAVAILDLAISKYKQLKSIHEMDPPIPLHVQMILNNNIYILKVMWLKYSIQSGAINPNDWRKKVDQQFGNDVNLKLLSLVQCLRTQTRKQSNVFQKSPYSSFNKNFKETLIQAGFDLVKPFLQTIQKSLTQQKSKIQRQVTFKNTQQLTQQLINQQIKKKRQIQQKNVKLNDFKKASSSFPIEYHMELIHYAYETKNNKILNNLIQVALLRIECRRIQVPYIGDVGIIASSTANPNIPNGYQKINVDLNEANLRIQLKKLRKKNQSGGAQEQKPAVQVKDAKDAKKGGKDAKAPVVQQIKKPNKDAPTQMQLQQINHKYVYIIIKRTMNPQNAVYELNIVMGDEEEGPVGYVDTRRIVVPYIQDDMAVQQSKLKQYKGIKQSTHMVPYIILKHSKTSLEDEEQKKQALTDVMPLVGKSPIIPPAWGYKKIPIDLRQVPQQFIKNSNHDYAYITYKNDQLFYLSQRHIRIINSLNELESSITPQKVQNATDQKLLQLGINYSLQKLNNLFIVLQQCLDGRLGQQYYISRCDFLTQLTYQLWIKYLRGPLVQFHYLNEMRLNQQVIDYDYQMYKEALGKAKPVLLNGFKVLNFILINNQKSDILLLSRINLELMKLLEQEREYKQAFQNAKMCLDRIRTYRDQSLVQGLIGSKNRLLPFCLTCSNIKIKQTFEKMKKKFQQQRNYIQKLKRIKQRKQNQELSQQLLQEQQNQYLHYKKKDEIDETIQKVQTSHQQIITILAAIQLNTYNLYFRNMLKYAENLRHSEKLSSNSVINGIKQSNLQGLASSMKNKLSLMYGKNQLKNQKNLKQLQSTLIQAQKLAPSKPGLHWLQKKTIQQTQKNPYAFALLMGNFAAINSQSEDKKYFLQQAVESIKKCIQQQNKQCQQAVNHAIFVYSSLWDNNVHSQISSSQISPFKQLYNGVWSSESQVPSQPILISKNSTSISIKMPPFENPQHKKKKKKLKNMSLYGKPSANGVDVSTNCNELQGTGLQNKIDQIVKVSNLTPNNVYCFAVASINDSSDIQPIGRTCNDIRTVNPLPISMLAAYVAKISYQINEYQIAYLLSKIVVGQVCEQSLYKTTDEKTNIPYEYKFKQQVLKNMSLLQVRCVVQSLYIIALCERRNLKQLKQSNKGIPLIQQQFMQQRITNWLMLASILNPCLTCPIISIPFLIPDDFVVLKALSLMLIHPKWMNSKLRELGVKVMEKVLKWGLQKNQIGLARRITYKWIQRKWLMLGKVIQIQQKKQAKKGAKDSKQQETKMIDKYCRMLIQKSSGQIEMFQDSLATISEQYSDYTTSFIERAKEQITYYSQFVDNTPQQLDNWTNKLNSKLQLVQYLKDPINSIKKIAQSSPFYLQYNCKILRKALQNLNPSQNKTLLTKSQQLAPINNKQLTLSKQIQTLMLEAISNNIEWIPSAKNEVMRLQQKTGKNMSKQIQLYTNFENKYHELTKSISKMDSLVDKYQDYDYLNVWLSQLYFLKAIIATINCNNLSVKNPIKGRYDKVKFMNLQDLLKKKKQIQILDKQSVTYSQDDIKFLTQIMKLLCDAAFSSFCIQNWQKLQNVIKFIYNLINRYSMTPFYHKQNQIWKYFAFISLLSVLMLKKIRTQGYETFKKRYHSKMARTQLRLVATKLGVEMEPQKMLQVFEPKYFMPQLDPNTTKNYWFEKQSRIDLQAIGSIMAYTVQTLRIQNKYNLAINLTRDFCNVTQHYYSLQFLPFMIQSQQKLIDEVKQAIDKQNVQLNQVVNQFTKKKTSKMKGQRQHKLTNEPLPYQIQYEQKRKKILQSMELLTNNRNYLQLQIDVSQTVIDEIKRDTSKTVLKQRQQRKYLIQFGDDQQHMFKNYGEDTRLAKNRKSAVKDIIDQYDKIYKDLKENKTSKDPLAQLQNRNQVGNLYFTIGSYEKAAQFWQDAFATIFKTTGPIDKYLQILKNLKSVLGDQVGQKQIFLSLNLLFKIAKYGSFNKLYYQYNCTMLANKLAFSLFQSDARHPKDLLGHARYRLTKLSNKDTLQDQATISLSELVNSLQYFSLRLIDMGCSVQALPLLNLYEHITIDIAKNVEYSVRVKIIKAIALANIGLINQCMFYLAKIANQKDLPSIWVQPSDQVKRQKGHNWYFQDFTFDNSKLWNDATNKQAIQYIKKLALKNDFVINYGIVSIPLFNYTRGLLLSKIFAQEIYDNYENNQLRINNLQQAQAIMRQSLKRLAFIEQHYANLQQWQKGKQKLNKNQLNQQAEKSVELAKNTTISYLKANNIEQALMNKYQTEKPSALKKVFRIQFIARIRYSIYQSHIYRRLTSNAFHVLKNALTNIHRMSYNSRKVETGYDPQIGVQPAQQPVPAKKDDKKGAKKQEEAPESSKQQINWQKQKQSQTLVEQSLIRNSINIFWHIKISFQIGKLMYQQNSYKTSKQIIQKLIEQCKQFNEHYYSIFAQGYYLRCQLRLGKFEPPKFLQLIQLAQKNQFQREQYVNLVMDVGQIFKDQSSVQLFKKGKDTTANLWGQLGMAAKLLGIDSQYVQKMFTNKPQLTADQQQQIKRKSKKQQKKAGKDDKKAAKKQDSKKKKQQNKVDYKIELLSKYEWQDLLDEQKMMYQSYIFKPHPNFTPNNIYSQIPLQYIRCFIMHMETCIDFKFQLKITNEFSHIKKLIKIVESYPFNGYYYLVHLYFCIAQTNKKVWRFKLDELISNSKSKKIVYPYGDLPTNSQLTKLPNYSQFVFDNKQYLKQAETYYKKIISLIKGNCLLFQNGFGLNQVLWRAADNQLYLAQYFGRSIPKFYYFQNSANAQSQTKLQQHNQIGQAINQLQLSIKITSCANELYSNYTELGSKPLQPTAKLDADIVAQIGQIDKQFKLSYQKLLSDALKPKQAITSLQLITYLTKIHRQSQLFTFSNSHLQNIIYRCHRILQSASQSYKEKCLINNTDYTAKKTTEQKIIQIGGILFKSRLNGINQQFIYFLGPGATDDKNNKVYYGRISIQSTVLSQICQKLYNIRSKMAISDKKSQAIKNRDFMLYQKQLKKVLADFGSKFYPALTEFPEGFKVALSIENISVLIKMLQSSGVNTNNKQINSYLRYLHTLKYKIKDVIQ